MLQQICRTCLATHGELVPIFTNNYYVHNLPEKLRHTIRIEVSKDDDLPKMMCKKCVFLVDSLCCFKDQCEMAEVKLKKNLSKSPSKTKKSSKAHDLDLPEFDSSKDDDYSDGVSSSEDEYHIEYVSEEARLAVEGAKRSRRRAKRKSLNAVKVKSVEVVPKESKNNSFRSPSYKNDISEVNEEINISDSDISSYCVSEDSKKFSNTNPKSHQRQQPFSKPTFKRKLELNNSYSRLTKVPKKVMFKDSEYDDENTQVIQITEIPKPNETKPVKPTERSLPSTKIDTSIFKKKNRNLNQTTSPKVSHNSIPNIETPKPVKQNDVQRVFEMRMKSLMKHVVLINPRTCTICSDSFDTYSAMLKHKVQMHMNPDETAFFCPICNEKFLSHKNLITHLDDHTDISSLMCVLCSEHFYTDEMMRSHLGCHTNVNDLTCVACKTKYERISGLLLHLDAHINKHLVCTFCIDSFDSKDLLQNHINEEHEVTLENVKPVPKTVEPKVTDKKKIRYPCSQCDRNFANPVAVREHVLQKHPDFTCLVCDKKFPSQEERSEHTKQCHMKPEQTGQIPSVDRKKFLCRVCHEILISRAAYSQHLKEKHCSTNQPNEKDLHENDQNEQSSQNTSNPPTSDMT